MHNVTGSGEEVATCSVCLGTFQTGETVQLLRQGWMRRREAATCGAAEAASGRESKGDVVPTAKADADEPECASGGGGEGIWGIQLLFYPSIIKIN